MSALLEKLTHSLIVGDGAMATQLYKLGVPAGICCQELCLSNPALVRSVHTSYLEAGADLLETNTFGANRNSLSRYGLEKEAPSINRTAALLAREAAGDRAFVAGAISSVHTGHIRIQSMRPYRDQFEEQALALLDGGVDALLLETFLDLDELLLALDVTRALTSLPLIAQLATPEAGQTRDGIPISDAFQQLKQAGADIVGLNCRLGPSEMLRTLEECQIPADAFLSVFPNAGYLDYADGEFTYTSSPAYFAESALRFREQGVRIIGGCCGTTPDHIRAMRAALDGLAPMPRLNPAPAAKIPPPPSPLHVAPPPKKETLVDQAQRGLTVIVELDPPKDLRTGEFLRGCRALQSAGAAAITLAENSLASVRMSNLALGTILKNSYGIEPLLHLTCRDRNLIGQQSHLMGLYALGIDHILIITGDPTRIGDLPGSSSVFDVNSFEMIRLTKQLNEGVSFSGRPLQRQANFVIGAAFNPYVHHFEASLKRLERKIAAGADFIMTQPIYDPEMILRIHETTRHLDIPIFIGLMPLTGQRNAEFLHHEVPGIQLSPESLERMRGLSGAAGRREGVKLCRELLDVAVRYFHGIYLITPFQHYDMTAELTAYLQPPTST
ncbi:MAG: bifunctional homocysteine S-methyltransferase/methylenetetrahydrofolate reductase [Peptococcaceae bacterium]|jgi:homocysteine S-methyltransferase|nr:bifunctional homocysteine S-methyltransferase/methylenetetrahydrofolate reductase [Peptococcaceae bacterium]